MRAGQKSIGQERNPGRLAHLSLGLVLQQSRQEGSRQGSLGQSSLALSQQRRRRPHAPMMMPTNAVARLNTVMPTLSPMAAWMVWQSSLSPCSKRPAGWAASKQGSRQWWVQHMVQGIIHNCHPHSDCPRPSVPCCPATSAAGFSCVNPQLASLTTGGCGVKVSHILAQHRRQVDSPHAVHLAHACNAGEHTQGAGTSMHPGPGSAGASAAATRRVLQCRCLARDSCMHAMHACPCCTLQRCSPHCRTPCRARSPVSVQKATWA